jgi:ribose transport system substrate-binding protein
LAILIKKTRGQKMKKSLVYLAVGMLIFTMCLGSSLITNQAKAAEEYKISVVLKALNSDYWKSVKAGAEAAAEKYGVNLSVIGPNNETQVIQQINLLEDQLVKGVQGLVVAPLRPQAAKTVLEKAVSRDIAVITIDTDAEFEGKTSFAGTGNFQAAEKAGKYFADILAGQGKVAIIRGAAGDYIHDQRVDGFMQGIEGTAIEVVSVQPADSSRGKAVNVMQNIIQSYPDVNAVYATNDEMALGAERALKSANQAGVKVMGFDGSPDALKSIRNGELTATVKQDSYGIGYTGVELMVKHLAGETVASEVPVPTFIIDQNNVDASIRDLTKAFSRDRLEVLFGEDVIAEVFAE